MTSIYVECEYTLARKGSSSEADESYIFRELIGDITIEVDVSYSRGSAIAKVFGAELPDECIDELKQLTWLDGDKLSPFCRDSIHPISRLASDFTRRILSTLKYHLDHDDFSENTFAIKSQKWGLSKDDLHGMPSSFSIVASGGSICPLREDSYEKVKASLEAGIKPLLAMRHLHRARHEHSSHHKWIDATIAAELAIKEVLARANPNLESLLLELPSPPLSKLYGKIMEEYLGEQSPYRKSLIKGAEVRNALVHRHDDTTVDGQEAVAYVQEVDRAIFHLLTLLYPDDALIQGTYARKKL